MDPEKAIGMLRNLRRGGDPARAVRNALEHDLAAELLCEQAISLGRAGRHLAAACAAARQFLAEIGPDPSDRQRAEYGDLYRIARHARWKLVVQREAMGLLHHRALDEAYPMPPPPK